jgi:hypothetical protein
MKTCPTCKGNKTVTCTVSEGDKATEFTMPCHACHGKGTMTEAEYKAWQRYLNSWCRCGNKSGEVTFYDDDQHPECRKHHWRCADCGKILQVG